MDDKNQILHTVRRQDDRQAPKHKRKGFSLTGLHGEMKDRTIHKHICMVGNEESLQRLQFLNEVRGRHLTGEGEPGRHTSFEIQHPREELLGSAECPPEVCNHEFKVKPVS